MKDSGPPYILALDIGTSGIRASVYDSAANELPLPKARSSTPFSKDGTVEPAAETLFAAVVEVLDAVSGNAREYGIRPALASVSCFWHSLIGIDGNDDPTTAVLTWADTRAEGSIGWLRETFDESLVHDRTGCHFHSSYWPAKLLRLRSEDPEAFAGTRKWLSFSDYVMLRLTGSLGTGISMASGTGLFDLRKDDWDTELCDGLGIPRERFPDVLPSGSELTLDTGYARRWPSLAASRWLPPIGDGAANNIGAGCIGPGRAALMIGTSGALRMVMKADVPESVPDGLFCYRLDRDRICIGGALSDGGSLRRWLTGDLGLDVKDEDIRSRIVERGSDSHGLSFLPFVHGERSTGYHEGASGAVIGLTRGSDAVDFVTAALESVAYRFAEILERLETVCKLDSITVSGGAIESSGVWQQIISDVLGRDLQIHPAGGVSRKGAALTGLEHAGVRMPAETGTSEMKVVRFDTGSHNTYGAGREPALKILQPGV